MTDVKHASRGRRLVIVFTVLAALCGGPYWYATRLGGHEQTTRAPRAPVPVTVATATRQDLPIYFTGLGTVQAPLTVAIHSQVDGRLQDVLFKEGQRVRKGDVLARIDPRLFQAALDQAKAREAQDQAQLVGAQKDLNRFMILVARNFQSQQNAETQLDYTILTAPNDGRMGLRLVDPGNIIRAADAIAIATLVLTQPMDVVFSLPSRSLDDVREALARGEVEVTTFDRDNEHMLSRGKLLMVDNQVDPATSSYRLKAKFDNQDERLWPGDFVNARVLVETRSQVITVPTAAVQTGPDGLFAWVIDAGNAATVHPIAIGPTTDDRTIVTSGVAAGDRVVVEGQFKLALNSPVTATTAKPPASLAVRGPS